MGNEKILICDDEPGMRLVLSNVLKPEGYNVLVAEDGAEAINKLKNDRPQLLLLDMRLPDMDGLEILAEAKKIAPQLPVVMLSGFADVESAVGAMKRGAFDYLSKPFRVDDVKKIVLKALGSQTLAKEGLLEREQKAPSPTETAEKMLAGTKKKGRSPFVPVAGVLLLAAAGAGLWKFRGQVMPVPADKEFSAPYVNPTAICYAGEKVLWVSDWVTSSLYRHSLDESLSVGQIFQIPGGHPTGVAWDGVNIWTSNSWEQKIYKHNMDATLSVAAEYPSPGPEPSGLTWDGVSLWVCDFKEANFYRLKISEEGLTVLNNYDSPGPRPAALFVTGENVWSADSETNRIYKHAKDDKLTVQAIYVAPPFESRQIFLSGLAWDGKYLYTCADEHPLIHRHSLKSLKEIKF